MRSRWAISMLIAGTVWIAAGAVPRMTRSAAAADEKTQVIQVTAKKYEYEPSTIRVKQGTRVQLQIKATDHAHGFRVSELAEGAKGNPGLIFSSPQDCTKIEEGKTETVEFVAQAPGTYPFRCCVHCGWHHRAMKGQVIVEP